MKGVDFKKINEIIDNFNEKRVLVLGDLMLDKYLWGHVARISPEAPVPVVEVKKDTFCLGGAGNVSRNLESLGALSILVGVVGKDPDGEWIRNATPNNQGIITDSDRPTTVKTRIIAQQQQVVRVDQEKKNPISPRIEKKIFKIIQQEKYDGILISDYNKGTLTKSLMDKILPFARKEKIPVFVDPKVENFFFFSPIMLINPNHIEAEKIVHHPCITDTQVEKAGQKMLSQIETKYLILKRGELGLSVFEKGKIPFHIPTIAKEVYDVTGAGDTVIAAVCLALLSGASILEAAVIANTAAGIVVGKIGTATVTTGELIEALDIQK